MTAPYRFERDGKEARAGAADDAFAPRTLTLHGHEVIYRMLGAGPPVVLIHGLVNSSRHWRAVATRLADDYTVIAPDLLGHGYSAKPQGDYSLGGHASGIRDLLSALGVERATIIGHSIGGGIAMQFFYQFPERCERFALVSSGGLGREVSWSLRAASLPGAGFALSALARRRTLASLERAGNMMSRVGLRAGRATAATARSLRPLEEDGARRAFLATLREVVDVHGQRISARDRLYLAENVPTLIVWGERDRTIPLEHGRLAHAQWPHGKLATLPRSGHFPHLDDPDGLARVLREFISTTEPTRLDEPEWQRLLGRRKSSAGTGVSVPG